MSDNKTNHVCMVILDGWGFSNNWAGNAIKLASPKNYDRLWASFGHKVLDTYDKSKPAEQLRLNSEVCHTTISTSRFVPTIDDEIANRIDDQKILANETLKGAFDYCKKNDSSIHLVSPLDYSEQSINYINSVLKAAENYHARNIFIHLVIHDHSGIKNKLFKIKEIAEKYQNVKIVSLMASKFITLSKEYGDIIRGYRTIIDGEGKKYLDFDQAISLLLNDKDPLKDAQPAVLYEDGKVAGRLEDFDSVIFTYTSPEVIKVFFSYFTNDINIKKLGRRVNLNLVAFSDYLLGLSVKYSVAFEPLKIVPNIPSVLSNNGLTQAYISDNTKIENVGYYFHGRSKQKFPDEKIMTVTTGSPIIGSEIETATLNIAKVVVDQLMNRKTDFILVNFASVDYFAHIGSIKDAARAVSSVDQAIGMISDAAIGSGVSLIITSDHGNAESMASSCNDFDAREHTSNPVPFILISNGTKNPEVSDHQNHFLKSNLLAKHGSVLDIAPTVLELFAIDKPMEFAGESLLNKLD